MRIEMMSRPYLPVDQCIQKLTYTACLLQLKQTMIKASDYDQEIPQSHMSGGMRLEQFGILTCIDSDEPVSNYHT